MSETAQIFEPARESSFENSDPILKNKQELKEFFEDPQKRKMLMHFCVRYAGKENMPFIDAEDICHDVWIKANNAIEGFNRQASIKTWIFKIAQTLILDRLRKKKRRKNTVSYEEIINNREENSTNPGSMSGEDSINLRSPEDNHREPELQKLIRDKVLAEKLKEYFLKKEHDDWWKIMEMMDMQEFTVEEIAKILNMNENTVKVKHFRAKNAARAFFASLENLNSIKNVLKKARQE